MPGKTKTIPPTLVWRGEQGNSTDFGCGGESKDNSTDFGVAVKNKDNYTDFGVAEKARTIPSTLVWLGEQGQFH